MRDKEEVEIVEIQGRRSEDWQSTVRSTPDRVWIRCPDCSAQIFFIVERGGANDAVDYGLDDAPLGILVELTKHAQACTGCGVILKLAVAEPPKMRIEVVSP